MSGTFGAAAIVGIGATEFSKDSGRTELQLAAEAIRAALADAGLAPAEVDGLVTYTIDTIPEIELARNLGFGDLLLQPHPLRRRRGLGTLQHAAMAALATGAADVVVCYRAFNERSGRRFGAACRTGRPVHTSSDRRQYSLDAPVRPADAGVVGVDVRAALHARVRRHQRGLRPGRRALTARTPRPTRRPGSTSRPITLEDHQQSRWIAEPAAPVRLLPGDRRRPGPGADGRGAGRRPAGTARRRRAAARAGIVQQDDRPRHYLPRIAGMPATGAGAAAVGRSGLGPDDVDVASSTTPSRRCASAARGVGLLRSGRGQGLRRRRAHRPRRQAAVNTNGGLIGEGYIHGLNGITEAVRQLRGTAVNQATGGTSWSPPAPACPPPGWCWARTTVRRRRRRGTPPPRSPPSPAAPPTRCGRRAAGATRLRGGR